MLDSLVKFVAKGGVLLFPQLMEDTRLGFLLGLKETANFDFDIKCKGIYLSSYLLPGIKGVSIKPLSGNYGLKLSNFSEKVNVFAWSSKEKEFPIIIHNNIGLGKVVYYNTGIPFEKFDRGLLFSGILNGLKGVPYPVANTNTIFLDDFPSPLYNQKKEPIKSEMDLTITDYVQKIWWKDMTWLAKKYNMKYTAMLTFDYTNMVYPPFNFNQWESQKREINGENVTVPHWLVNNVAKEGHELGFHGYNHVSLLKPEWKNPDNIHMSLKTVLKKWQVNDYGDFPITYVPPSNDVDDYGLDHLKQSIPSLKYMCSLYLGDKEIGAGREFDYDPYQKNMFDYPRITYGFNLEDDLKYTQQSMYLYTGIWTHFVHPDDVYQTPENAPANENVKLLRNRYSLGWRKTGNSDVSLLSKFDNYLSEHKALFPHSRFLTAAVATPLVIDWRASRFEHTKTYTSITVKRINEPLHNKSELLSWFVYFPSNELKKAESEIKKQAVSYSSTNFLNGKLFHVISKENQLTFSTNTKEISPEKLETIIADFVSFKKTQAKHFSGELGSTPDEDYDLKLKTEKKRLRTKIDADSAIDYSTWNKYAYFISWEDKGKDVWDLLDERCKKNPIKNNFMYSYELEKILGYPTDSTQVKWHKIQYKWNPSDLTTLKNYLSIISEENNQKEIETVLRLIYEIEPNEVNKKNYLHHLLTHNHTQGCIEVEKLIPAANLDSNLIADIVWFYASEKDYQKALDWAKFTNKVPFSNRLLWLAELRKYTELDTAYYEHMNLHPGDEGSKAIMAHIYHSRGRFLDSWVMARSLEPSKERDELKKMLNRDVIHEPHDVQKEILKNYEDFLTPEAKEHILHHHKIHHGDFVTFNSGYSTFMDTKLNFFNIGSFNHYDKNKNLHTYSVTHANMYPIQAISETDDDNKFQIIYGANYQFRRRALIARKNFSYYFNGGIERSSLSKIYFNGNAGFDIADKLYYLAINVQNGPLLTSPGYVKNINNLRLCIYYQTAYKKLEFELYSEGNNYSKLDITTGDINLKNRLRLNKQKMFKFTPVLETAVSKSNHKIDISYPYFILRNRIWAGAGPGVYIGREKDRFYITCENMFYIDSYSGNFYNVRGLINYRLFKYTYFNANYDLFVQTKYYSNTVGAGIKHIF